MKTISKYLKKGNQLLVSGRLQQRTWQDKDTGKNRSALDVVVEEFSLLTMEIGMETVLQKIVKLNSRSLEGKV